MGIPFFFRKKKTKIGPAEDIPLSVPFSGDEQLVRLLQSQGEPSHNEEPRSERTQNKPDTVEFLSFMTQDHLGWICKECGARNAIVANDCEVCGLRHT